MELEILARLVILGIGPISFNTVWVEKGWKFYFISR
jgi:hypothetical protein